MAANSIGLTARALVLALCVTAPLDGQSKNAKKDPDQIGNRDVGSGINFYSLEKEIALGKQLAQEVERQAKLLTDPITAEFVNRLSQNLARNSDIQVPVTAKIIDSDQVNAFALPGGFLFVNTGLIAKAETEAELAGPLAHEIAHVAARHGTRQVSRAQIANYASLPLIFMGGWGGFAARQGLGLAVPLGFLKFSRGFEQEADMLGVQYMYKAGYDPTAFVDFFEKITALERKKPGTLAEIFRSHPSTETRIKTVQANIQDMLRQQPQYVITTSEFDAVRLRISAHLNRSLATPARTGPTLYGPKRGAEKAGDGEAAEDERPTLKRRDPQPER